ncbi:hypothetical protein WJX73_000008 [Symbiochloris irregularis]|uniref:Tubulin/FtsZ GTPase domain-containing protein n=1 Tax=Symbiochloris irregularis TaxID=706552 RepID=A0AAW1PR26_9CHLO
MPQAEGSNIRVIGLGSRGGSAAGRLWGRGAPSGAQLWCLDNDRATLDTFSVPNTMLLPSHAIGENAITAAELQRIIGNHTPAAGGGNGAPPSESGVAFITASAGAIPGGSGTLLHLAGKLRTAGFFTIVAVTKPFAFEGPRKMEAANFLISQLAEHSNLVAVVEQDVLSEVMTNAGGTPMTVAEATLIADNALEHTVRCMLAAMATSEILKSTQGAMLWHGVPDTRRPSPDAPLRGISALLRQALTHPGAVGSLGRGTAVMPGAHASQLGRPTALMHLASDAVRAASTSPFLEGTQGRGGIITVLCTLALPPPTPHLSVADGGMVSAPSHQEVDQERAAVRLAAQAAAGALSSVCPCHNIVICPTTLHSSPQVGDHHSGSQVAVEASLLILRDPFQKPWSAPSADALDNLTPASNQFPSASRSPNEAASSNKAQQQPRPLPQQGLAAEQLGGKRLPASAWKAMSAMAGGTGTGVASTPAATPPTAAPAAAAAGNGAVGRKGAKPRQGVSPHTVRTTTPYQHEVPKRGSGRARPASDSSSAPEGEAQARAGDFQQPSQSQGTITGGFLVDSLTAQSLDLPPQAVKWRQQQRSGQSRPRLILLEAGDPEGSEDGPESAGKPGASAGAHGSAASQKGVMKNASQLLAALGISEGVDVRLRTSGILERDREDAWDAVD